MSGTVKCLVWDLDGTLWPGTVLEGDEITVTDEVRAVIVELDSRGILQSIASRNAAEDVWPELERLGLDEYFVVPQIGWGRKSDAVREIARRLSFAASAVAFIDDQPWEIEEVRTALPDVRCFPASAALALPSLQDFTPATVTPSARNRRAMYHAGLRREQARAEHPGLAEEFIRSLEIVMELKAADEEDIDRIEELALRTSQMNATGVHYSSADLRALVSDPGHTIVVSSMADRFGDHGAIGVMLVEHHDAVWHLKLVATSCRVMPFGAGGVMLRWLIDRAAQAGVHLIADFRPTNRNRIMEVTYRFAGFSETGCACAVQLTAADAEIQRLHLVPSRQPAPAAMTLQDGGLPAAAQVE